MSESVRVSQTGLGVIETQLIREASSKSVQNTINVHHNHKTALKKHGATSGWGDGKHFE